MIGKLVYCIDCNKIINFTEYDFSSEYTWLDGKIINERERDDRLEFLREHKDHRTEALIPLTSPASHESYSNPSKTSYFRLKTMRGIF